MTETCCANEPCEDTAEFVIPATNTPLCRTCAEAYTWGQNDIDPDAIPEGRILEWINSND